MNKSLSQDNFHIKLKDHYKLYVLLKDKIIFESELEKSGIEYFSEINEQPFIDRGIRYFLLDSDREKVADIIVENTIVASTESHLILDFRDEKKVRKLYLALVAIVVGIIILAALVEKVFY